MDLALLGVALKSRNAEPRRVAVARAAVAGVTALDVLASRQLTRIDTAAGHRQPSKGNGAQPARQPDAA